MIYEDNSSKQSGRYILNEEGDDGDVLNENRGNLG